MSRAIHRRSYQVGYMCPSVEVTSPDSIKLGHLTAWTDVLGKIAQAFLCCSGGLTQTDRESRRVMVVPTSTGWSTRTTWPHKRDPAGCARPNQKPHLICSPWQSTLKTGYMRLGCSYSSTWAWACPLCLWGLAEILLSPSPVHANNQISRRACSVVRADNQAVMTIIDFTAFRQFQFKPGSWCSFSSQIPCVWRK